jgi:hypothetical protein
MSEEKNDSVKSSEDQTFRLNDTSNDNDIENTNKDILSKQVSSQQALIKTDQQPSESTGSQSQDLFSIPIERSQPNEEILQPTTDNMEVHHHPHVHHSKKWKNYLYEFLMLFLAVTAGFFVENLRENYIEHHRAKQFSKQLLADLRLDSLMFENWNRNIQGMQKGHDSLLYLLIQKTGATDKEILETLLPITFVFDAPATTTTYNQMKTSGSLRYIENTELTADLQHYYDVLLPRCIKIAEASLNYFSQNINPFYLKHIRIQDFDPFNDSLINKKPVIMEHNMQTNQELANIMGGFRSILKIQAVTMNDPALKKIKETMLVLKKEYDLE